MDKPLNATPATPGYETRDAHVGGAFKFLLGLGIVLIASALVCWGMFRLFSMQEISQQAPASPFADTRPLPLGPQLQVNPREDWLKFREEQQKSLETLAWENQTAGTVRVPIEEAMDLLVKKGLPVQGAPQAQPADARKPAQEGGKKP
jgi:hypothetical protein